ncbi:MAG: hypothetical protein KJ906_03905 [Nanoarchaeota archaeon]|nr:hypothetical protein [Nanoarchaeota archaeon]
MILLYKKEEQKIEQIIESMQSKQQNIEIIKTKTKVGFRIKGEVMEGSIYLGLRETNKYYVCYIVTW